MMGRTERLFCFNSVKAVLWEKWGLKVREVGNWRDGRVAMMIPEKFNCSP